MAQNPRTLLDRIPSRDADYADRIKFLWIEGAAVLLREQLTRVAETFDAAEGSTAERLDATFAAFVEWHRDLHSRPILVPRQDWTDWEMVDLREVFTAFGIPFPSEAPHTVLLEALAEFEQEQVVLAQRLAENGQSGMWEAYRPMRLSGKVMFSPQVVTMPDYLLDEN